VIVQGEQEPLVELERAWELARHLPHSLQELGEDGRRLLRVDGAQEAAPVRELVSERQPLLLYQCLETIHNGY